MPLSAGVDARGPRASVTRGEHWKKAGAMGRWSYAHEFGTLLLLLLLLLLLPLSPSPPPLFLLCTHNWHVLVAMLLMNIGGCS